MNLGVGGRGKGWSLRGRGGRVDTNTDEEGKLRNVIEKEIEMGWFRGMKRKMMRRRV